MAGQEESESTNPPEGEPDVEEQYRELYNRLDDGDGKSVTASMLLRTWKMHGRVGSGDLDINAAWYAIRDVRAKIVVWQRCPHCQAGFIYEPNESHARSCPFCALSRRR